MTPTTYPMPERASCSRLYTVCGLNEEASACASRSAVLRAPADPAAVRVQAKTFACASHRRFFNSDGRQSIRMGRRYGKQHLIGNGECGHVVTHACGAVDRNFARAA